MLLTTALLILLMQVSGVLFKHLGLGHLFKILGSKLIFARFFHLVLFQSITISVKVTAAAQAYYLTCLQGYQEPTLHRSKIVDTSLSKGQGSPQVHSHHHRLYLQLLMISAHRF